jgi:hypothetical protein
VKGERAFVLIATLIFVGASLAAGVVSMARDLEAVLRQPEGKVLSPAFEEQARRVRGEVPPGVRILVIASESDEWEARLWQRALYPRNPVSVRLPPVADPAKPDADLVLTIGSPPPELRLRSSRRIDGPKPVVLGIPGE